MTKTIKLIFTISVLLNVLLLGFIGGTIHKKRSYWKDVKVELSEEGRDVIKKNMKASRQEMQKKFQSMKKNHSTLKKIIEAPEFDQDAYEKAVDVVLNSKDEMMRHRAQSMGKTLAELSLVERKKLSSRMLQSLSGDRRGPVRGDSKRRSGGERDKPRNRP